MTQRRLFDIETPALLADLEIVEHNLATMANFFKDKRSKLRPHFKNHRVLQLASRQMDAGAIGMTCSRLGQAEALVHHGIRNVLIANEVAGETMLVRFAELSKLAPVIVAIDNPSVVADMARVSRNMKVPLNVVVDVDLGLKRCGVRSCEEALDLAKAAINSGLGIRGLMGYEGHLQPLPPGPEKVKLVEAAVGKLLRAKEAVERGGIPVEIVSCGGTGDYSIAGKFAGVTEIQAGSFLLMDTWYAPYAPDFAVALSILATAISVTPGERIVLDAGVKAISGERGLPFVKGHGGLRVKALHAEHALIDIEDPSVNIQVGDKVELAAHYHDGTVNLHRQMYGVRNGLVCEVLEIEH